MSINSIASSSYLNITTVRSFPTDNLKKVFELPGSSERGQRLIDSLAQTNAGRKDSVQGYTSSLRRPQDKLQVISSQVSQLPAATTPKQREAWNAYLATAQNDVAYAQSQIGHYQSLIDNDPLRERTLKFAAGCFGISLDDVHKLYDDKIKALDAAKAASAAADLAAAQSGSAPTGDELLAEMRRGDPSGVHSEIKIDGTVVGFVFNSGAVVTTDEYGSMGLKLGFGSPGEDGLEGPDLAIHRIAQIVDAFKNSRVEILKASTAQTRSEWLASQASGYGHIDRSV